MIRHCSGISCSGLFLPILVRELLKSQNALLGSSSADVEEVFTLTDEYETRMKSAATADNEVLELYARDDFEFLLRLILYCFSNLDFVLVTRGSAGCVGVKWAEYDLSCSGGSTASAPGAMSDKRKRILAGILKRMNSFDAAGKHAEQFAKFFTLPSYTPECGEVRNTTGAGDTFCGGLVLIMLSSPCSSV